MELDPTTGSVYSNDYSAMTAGPTFTVDIVDCSSIISSVAYSSLSDMRYEQFSSSVTTNVEKCEIDVIPDILTTSNSAAC